MPSKAKITGQRFGRLVANHTIGSDKQGVIWSCKCDCGKEIFVRVKDLKNKHTRSCGCLKLDLCTKPKGEAAFNRWYKNYIRNANRRKIKFELTQKQFRKIIIQRCFYCGKEPVETFPAYAKTCNGNLVANGLDRLDNSKGYIDGNVVACCGRCNRAKDVYDLNDYKNWIEKSYFNLKLV